MKIILSAICLWFLVSCSSSPATMEFVSPTPAPTPSIIEEEPNWDQAKKPEPAKEKVKPSKKSKKAKKQKKIKKDLN